MAPELGDRRGSTAAAARPATDAERVHFVRYTRPERWPILDRFPVSADVLDELLAQMVAWTADDVRDCLRSFDSRAEEIAGELLTESGYRAAVRALPFSAGDRIAAVGDSLTADRLGWFDLFAASMRRTGRGDVVLENLAVSGSTTADALERYDLLEAFEPTHVLVMLGTNDARRHGRRYDARMISPAETRRNLTALLDLVVHDLRADVVLMTPPPADQQRISAFFDGGAVRWSAPELDGVAAIVRDLAPHCIDVHAALQAHPLDALMEDDGVHLNARGQQVLARQVVGDLVSPRPWRTRPPAGVRSDSPAPVGPHLG